jgi:large subunit ribosomal protein L6
MQSILLPPEISVSIGNQYLKRKGPRGEFYTLTGGLLFRSVKTVNGTRLVVSQPKGQSIISESSALAYISKRIIGLTQGYRNRLRLVGVGFRATRSNTSATGNKELGVNEPELLLKLGYSHEIRLSWNKIKNEGVDVTPSRLEGRTKATLLRLTGNDLARLNHRTSTIRDLRRPDPYKGKGVHLDGQRIKLKKGKREA